ncbi:MAG: metallophosphoesterase family protein [Thermoanaerobaculia bacterium]
MPTLRTLLHLSDVHFGPKHVPETAAGVIDLAAARRPSLVVISGDLTLRAKPAQFRAAREFAAELERIAPVLAVPGNHDVPLYRAWERLFTPYGAWRRHFRQELEPVFQDDELLVAGVNSAQAFAVKGGRIRRRRLAEVDQLLASAPPKLFRVVVVHHHLSRPPGVECEHPSWRSGEAIERWKRAGVDLVLSGHLHRTLELRPAGDEGFLELHTGTTGSSRGRGPERGRNSLHWIEVGSASFRVERHFWNGAAGRFEADREQRFERSPVPPVR